MNINKNCTGNIADTKTDFYNEALISDEQSRLFEKINKYVMENISDMNSISVNSIAEHFNISVGYVSKLYRRKTSKNFISYVLEMKVSEAKRLLCTFPDLKVKEIAVMLGYSNTLSFIRLFKRKTGMSPGKFRQKGEDNV